MSSLENQISIDHQGRIYSAIYKESNGVVSVTMQDGEGAYRGASTYIDGSSAESVARSLLGELLRDMVVF